MNMTIMTSSSGVTVDPEAIVHSLKTTLRYQEVYQTVLYQRIIDETAQSRQLSVTTEEIQAEADRFRYEHQLEKASDALTWLAEQQVSSEDWESGIRDRLLTEKLKEHLFGSQIEQYFEENRLDFEQVLLYQIIVPYEQLAQELFYQIEEREISFFEAAHLYDIEPQRRLHCGCEGKVYRWGLNPDIAAIVFGATPGQLLRPTRTDQGFHIMLVEAFIEAELSPDTRTEILNQLFDEWLRGELNYLLHC